MYILIMSDNARAYVQSRPKAHRKVIGYALYRLQRDPKIGNIKRLQGSPYLRLRVGDYRIIYDIDHGKVIISVIKISDRGDAY